MNTKFKIVAGTLAGLIAGVMLVGTAVAAPRMMTGRALNGYGVTRSPEALRAFDAPTIAEMNAFMDAYRTPAGSIDVGRMRADVTSGKATPPCLRGTSDAKASAPRAGQETARPSTRMMGGGRSAGGPDGYGMMGFAY